MCKFPDYLSDEGRQLLVFPHNFYPLLKRAQDQYQVDVMDEALSAGEGEQKQQASRSTREMCKFGDLDDDVLLAAVQKREGGIIHATEKTQRCLNRLARCLEGLYMDGLHAADSWVIPIRRK